MSAPITVSSTEDAIVLAELALGDDEATALVLDARIMLTVGGGDAPPDAVDRWHTFLLARYGGLDDRLVLASRRRTGPAFVLEDELGLWRTMQARHCNRELVLADWFVFVRDEVVLSLAELAGPEAVWS